eukprot:scaffold604_cov59-Phaeocystis_antarctica.AAC.8
MSGSSEFRIPSSLQFSSVQILDATTHLFPFPRLVRRRKQARGPGQRKQEDQDCPLLIHFATRGGMQSRSSRGGEGGEGGGEGSSR